MAFTFVLLLICLGLRANASPQQNAYLDSLRQYSSGLRSGISQIYKAQQFQAPFEGRFLTGATLTIATSTSTSTFVSIITCTTSTAALSACSPSSGRKRRANSDDLFFKGEEVDNYFQHPDDSVALNRADRSSNSVDTQKKPTPAIILPVIIEPGFGDASNRNARFLVSFTTVTTTIRTTSVSQITITAVCSSFTNWPVCTSASGK